MEQKRSIVDDMEGISQDTFSEILDQVEKSRHCTLGGFLYGMDIPLLTRKLCTNIDQYFEWSFENFENAISGTTLIRRN